MSEHTHGIPGEILTGRTHSPNGGLSARVQYVTIVGPGVPALVPVSDRAPAVVVGESAPGFTVLRPAEAPGEGRTSYMASGAYVGPSGAMQSWREVFGHFNPVMLLDRTETWEQYRMLSV